MKRIKIIFLVIQTIIVLTGCDFVSPTVKSGRLNKTGLEYADENNRPKAIEYFIKAAEIEGVPDTIRAIYFQNAGMQYEGLNNDSALYYYNQASKLHKR